MFREFLVYHHSSLEYRAKLLTLMITSNGEINECEEEKLKEIAHIIYRDDTDRADVLVDTVNEYHNKIITNNGLNFEDLVKIIERDTKKIPRFVKKIDIDLLKKLNECIDDDEDRLFQEHILEFLETLIEDNSKKIKS